MEAIKKISPAKAQQVLVTNGLQVTDQQAVYLMEHVYLIISEAKKIKAA